MIRTMGLAALALGAVGAIAAGAIGGEDDASRPAHRSSLDGLARQIEADWDSLERRGVRLVFVDADRHRRRVNVGVEAPTDRTRRLIGRLYGPRAHVMAVSAQITPVPPLKKKQGGSGSG